jgi:hypothetical protein
MARSLLLQQHDTIHYLRFKYIHYVNLQHTQLLKRALFRSNSPVPPAMVLRPPKVRVEIIPEAYEQSVDAEKNN